MCSQQRLKLACLISLSVHLKTLWIHDYPQNALQKLIRLQRCTDWWESSLGTHVTLKKMLSPGLFAMYLSLVIGSCNSTQLCLETKSHMGHVKRKSAFEHVQNVPIQLNLSMHKVSSGLLLFIHTFYSIISNESVSGEWRPWSDCVEAQADLGLCCLHMP